MINKIWRLLARLIKKKRNGMQIDKIQSEEGESYNNTEIKTKINQDNYTLTNLKFIMKLCIHTCTCIYIN